MLWIMPYDGTDWVFDDERRPTMHESRVMKRVSGGMVGDALAEARAAEDPDAWAAALVVARERAGLPLDEALRVDDRLLEMEDCIRATVAAAEARRDAARAAAEAAKPPRRVRRAKVAAEEPEPAEPAA